LSDGDSVEQVGQPYEKRQPFHPRYLDTHQRRPIFSRMTGQCHPTDKPTAPTRGWTRFGNNNYR
jgi:hypothetical protein